jgi:hypothetical protein
MTANREFTKQSWIDPDDAPELSDEVFARAQIAIGGRVVRPARGTLTRWFTDEELAERRASEEQRGRRAPSTIASSGNGPPPRYGED